MSDPCPQCGGPTVPQHEHSMCPRCMRIVQGCCEGSGCKTAPPKDYPTVDFEPKDAA